jgi:hypothetical protein
MNLFCGQNDELVNVIASAVADADAANSQPEVTKS